MREQGVIKKFFPDRGFGFIQRNGGPDLFFHIRQVVTDTPIIEGVSVEFEVQDTPKGPAAVNVEVVDYTTAS